MRTIKFRAIDIQTNKFVYGGLVVNAPSSTYRIVSNFALVCDTVIHRGAELIGCSGFFYNVVPETVCEFTGLKDKNGIDIYEGDIVRWITVSIDRAREITFSKATYFARTPKFSTMLNEMNTHEEVEIIGNTHQNPELLK